MTTSNDKLILTSYPISDFRELIREVIIETAPETVSAILVALYPPKPEPENDKYLTIKETAELLKVSVMTIHNLRKSGKLKYRKLGKMVRLKESEVLAMMKEYDWRKK